MHEKFEEAAHRGQAPLNAASAETFRMRVCGESANVLTVERTPVFQLVRIAKLHEGCEVPRIVGIRVRGQVALEGHVAPELRYTGERRRFHRPVSL